jgi:hypothetical protein
VSYLSVALFGVLALVLVLAFVSKISESKGGANAALSSAADMYKGVREYVKRTRRPVLSGSDLVSRLRSWSSGKD